MMDSDGQIVNTFIIFNAIALKLFIITKYGTSCGNVTQAVT
jgi:hypothetical protein